MYVQRNPTKSKSEFMGPIVSEVMIIDHLSFFLPLNVWSKMYES